MWLQIVLFVLVTFLIYKLLFSSKKDYWKKYGIREIDTSHVVSTLDVFIRGKNLALADKYAYDVMGGDKFCGTREMGIPRLILKDLDLIKKIMIKDFDYFTDRRNFFDDPNSALKKMLPSLEGDEWKGVRSAVSPTFTTGKIRRMMEIFNSVGEEWIAELKKRAKAKGGSIEIDVAEVVNGFTVEVIGSSVFGMKTGTIQNPNSVFAEMAAKIVAMGKWKVVKFTLSLVFPGLFKIFRIPLMDMGAMNFFQGILEQGLKERLSGRMKGDKNDFLQLLVEAKKGELKTAGNDELSEFEKDAQLKTGAGEEFDKKQYLTDEVMIAQSLVFFFAGFGTTSNLIVLTMYSLAVHQDVQDKLRREVGTIVKKNGSLDYDDLGKLVYMDMVLNEVLRMFPAAARLERKCVKDYKDPVTGFFAPKGSFVCIPIEAIHSDKRYFANADKFDPEHFSQENKAGRNPYAFLPFGTGPRNCIGMRFALVESKAAIAYLVHNFRMEPTEKTPIPMQTKHAVLQVLPPDDLGLKLIPLK
ncbi:unnamed protein product [Orchesella dallaii]|uniref:Cytochrome P450 9e2 n=1 Tax=Orchesella dallaii TaxID=48710 RepID=A0ABP1S6I7_9HEXA